MSISGLSTRAPCIESPPPPPPPPLFALSPSLSTSTNAKAQEDDDAKELQVQREIEQDKLYGRDSLALQEKKRRRVVGTW